MIDDLVGRGISLGSLALKAVVGYKSTRSSARFPFPTSLIVTAKPVLHFVSAAEVQENEHNSVGFEIPAGRSEKCQCFVSPVELVCYTREAEMELLPSILLKREEVCVWSSCRFSVRASTLTPRGHRNHEDTLPLLGAIGVAQVLRIDANRCLVAIDANRCLVAIVAQCSALKARAGNSALKRAGKA